jgi:two-component system, chemotaxis family, chemotaxis protein CheY
MGIRSKFLIVDDHLTTQMILKCLFGKLGYKNIVLAEDGETALYELKKNRFDFIMSDWNMPNPTGLEFLQKVRPHKPHKDVPFIMLTSEGTKEKVLEALKEGVGHYMVKPVGFENLEKKVKEVIK